MLLQPKIPKKTPSPYHEKLTMPIDWRSYEMKWFEWYKKCNDIVRSVVILPKLTIKGKSNSEEIDTNSHKEQRKQDLEEKLDVNKAREDFEKDNINDIVIGEKKFSDLEPKVDKAEEKQYLQETTNLTETPRENTKNSELFKPLGKIKKLKQSLHS